MLFENNRPTTPETVNDHLGEGYPVIKLYNSVRTFFYNKNYYGPAIFCINDITNSYKTIMFYRKGSDTSDVTVLNAKVQSNKLILTQNAEINAYNTYKFNTLGVVYTILALA